MLEYITIAGFTLINGLFLRVILGAAFKYVTGSEALLNPRPLLGVPLSIAMLLSGHSLGALLILGIFAIDYIPVVTLIANTLSPSEEDSKKGKSNA